MNQTIFKNRKIKIKPCSLSSAEEISIPFLDPTSLLTEIEPVELLISLKEN